MRSTSQLRSGVTLIEVIVAILVLTTGILSLELTAAASIRSLGDSGRAQRMSDLARSRLELLRSAPCRAASGVDSAPGVAIAWSASDTGNGLIAVTQMARFTTLRGLREQSYRALVPCT